MREDKAPHAAVLSDTIYCVRRPNFVFINIINTFDIRQAKCAARTGFTVDHYYSGGAYVVRRVIIPKTYVSPLSVHAPHFLLIAICSPVIINFPHKEEEKATTTTRDTKTNGNIQHIYIYMCARRVSVSLAATACCCCCLPQAAFVYEEIVSNHGISGGDVKVSKRLALYNDLFNFARIAVTTLMDCPPPDLLYGPSSTGRCTRCATPPP